MSKDLSDNFVVGREKEIDLITETLLRKNKNNPLSDAFFLLYLYGLRLNRRGI